MDTTSISILNEKTIKTKKTYKNLNKMFLQKNYLQIIKYTLNYSNNNRSPTNLLKTKKERDIYINPIRINLFESFIINKKSFFIL